MIWRGPPCDLMAAQTPWHQSALFVLRLQHLNERSLCQTWPGSTSPVWFGRRPVLLQKPPCSTPSPTTDTCDPPSGIIFPHCWRMRLFSSSPTHKCALIRDPFVSRCPIWNAFGPWRCGGPSLSRLGWGWADGLGPAVLDGRWWMGLTWWSLCGLAVCAVGVSHQPVPGSVWQQPGPH